MKDLKEIVKEYKEKYGEAEYTQHGYLQSSEYETTWNVLSLDDIKEEHNYSESKEFLKFINDLENLEDGDSISYEFGIYTKNLLLSKKGWLIRLKEDIDKII